MSSATAALLERIAGHGAAPALAEGGSHHTYTSLLATIEEQQSVLRSAGVSGGDVVGFLGDFRVDTIARHFALALLGTILVPLGTSSDDEVGRRGELGQLEWLIDTSGDIQRLSPGKMRHPLLEEVAASGNP